MLKQGDKAPDFALKDSEGNVHKLSDYRGRKVVLYFYPKDFTPGCTLEACSFRDNFSEIKKKGAVVLGVSADTAESHGRMRAKYKLPFTLLADTKKEVIKKYGALGQKTMFGKKFVGIIRSTFIIDESGKIAKIFPKVKVVGHTKEVLKYL